MPDMANDPVAWKSDYLRSSGQLSGCVLRHDASRVLVVEGAQRVGLVIDKWGVATQCAMVQLATGLSRSGKSGDVQSYPRPHRECVSITEQAKSVFRRRKAAGSNRRA
jgi:hypothetical protein